MSDPPAMKWYGWGDPSRTVHLSPESLTALRAALGADDRQTPAVPFEAVRLEESRLDGRARGSFVSVVGEQWVRDDRATRVSHAAGRGYPDLIRLRAGEGDPAPDAVVFPGGAADVQALLEVSVKEGVAVVPFGGGTSVVGGVEPRRGSYDSVVALDLSRLTTAGAIDRRSLTAELGAGLRGPQVEAALGNEGLTLGHYPQSFEYATFGGWIATRSAGQASTGYGRIDELVLGLRCATPAGEMTSQPFPATAAGPQLRELLVGSEGVLGVITSATVRVRPRPRTRRYEAWMVKGFAEGADAFRRLEQGGDGPDVARLSDETETAISLAMAGGRSLAQRAGRTYVKARGFAGGCLVIVGFEGESSDVARRRARTARLLRSAGAISLGQRPGRAWERERFAAPYLRDALLDHGILVETLETATRWSDLSQLYTAVSGALRRSLEARGTPPLVMCHVSHLYPSGASLYFTFLAAQEESAELEQWRAAKAAATDAIVAAGGTITHHHAIGHDHAPWLAREVGELGVEVVRSAKTVLDPAGVMNPGKLLPVTVGAEQPA